MKTEMVKMKWVRALMYTYRGLRGLIYKSAISFGRNKPTTLPTSPIHIIKYSSALTCRAVPLSRSFMASAVRHGCTQKHGVSLMGWFCRDTVSISRLDEDVS